MRIQHNIAAMSSYRNYTNNVSAVNKNLEKLSSGYKINRAGDDAAGLAISEKMRAQISGLQAAQKNAKDGISLVKTAEGALTEVHDMLNRMVTLATQSANGTYDNATDRDQLQKELDQLKSEIDRIADSSNFNGIKLLDGSMESKNTITGATDASLLVAMDGQLSGKTAQPGVYTVDLSQAKLVNGTTSEQAFTFSIGKSTGQTVTISVGANDVKNGVDVAQEIKEKLDALSKIEDDDGNEYTVTAENGKLTFTMKNDAKKSLDETKGFVFNLPTAGLDSTKNIVSNQGGEYHITVEQEPISASSERVYARATMKLTSDIVKDGGALKIGDTTYVFAVGANSSFKNYANVIDLTDKTADSADLLQAAAARLTDVAKDNKNFIVGTAITAGAGSKNDGTTDTETFITFTEKEGGVDYNVNNLAGTDGKVTGNTEKWHELKDTPDNAGESTKKNWSGLIQTGSINSAKSSNGLTLQIGDTADSYNQLKVSINDCHSSAIGIGSISIANQESAAAAIDKIKSAINYVSDVRGTLGATQNRLEHTINNLSVMTENIQDAESTIRDTDIAEEMMAYTKNNILVQSAQAMLAQANQIPQGVLQLLG